MQEHRSTSAYLQNAERRVDGAEFMAIAKAVNADAEALFRQAMRDRTAMCESESVSGREVYPA